MLRPVTEADKTTLVPGLRAAVYPHRDPAEWQLDPEDAPLIQGDVLELGGKPVGLVLVSVRQTTFAWPRAQCDPETDLFEDPGEYDRLNRTLSGTCLYLDDIGLLPEHRSVAHFLALLKAALGRAASLGLAFEASLRESTTGRLRRSPVEGWSLTARVRKLRHCGFRREGRPDEFEPYTLIRLEAVS